MFTLPRSLRGKSSDVIYNTYKPGVPTTLESRLSKSQDAVRRLNEVRGVTAYFNILDENGDVMKETLYDVILDTYNAEELRPNLLQLTGFLVPNKLRWWDFRIEGWSEKVDSMREHAMSILAENPKYGKCSVTSKGTAYEFISAAQRCFNDAACPSKCTDVLYYADLCSVCVRIKFNCEAYFTKWPSDRVEGLATDEDKLVVLKEIDNNIAVKRRSVLSGQMDMGSFGRWLYGLPPAEEQKKVSLLWSTIISSISRYFK